MENPKISVLMPVKNGAKYIGEAINSVLQQTFSNFELLIIDDGSTDKTQEIIQSYSDSRIRFERRTTNFIKNLNYGLEIANGEYVARMDADDIMHSERLRIQLKRMELNPEITVLSSWIKPFKNDGSPIPTNSFPREGWVENPILEMLKTNFISHPSVMIRKSFLQKYNLAYKDFECAEDYKLWFDIAKEGGQFFIEPRKLLFYRISDQQISVIKEKIMVQQSILIKKEILEYLLKTNDIRYYPVLHSLYNNLSKLEKEQCIDYYYISEIFYDIFTEIANKRVSHTKDSPR